MKKLSIKPNRPVFLSPVALITSSDGKNQKNIITLGEVFNLSNWRPVKVGIGLRKQTFSYSLIKETGEFGVNLAPVDILAKVDACGSVSGRNERDKFSKFGLTPIEASKISAPLVAECPVNIECRVSDIQSPGDHELIVGDVLEVHIDEDKMDERGHVIPATLNLIVYVDGEYWTMGKMVEKMWFTKSKNR